MKSVMYHYVQKFNPNAKYANYLDYYSDAILLYEEFKKTYPNDDLINSIDYELQNLSKFDKEIKSLLNSSK